MKLLPVLLLNLVTVGAGIVVYDQLRDDPVPPDAAVASIRGESVALEPRIEALEAERRPLLGGGAIDPRVVERLELLEDALRERGEADAKRAVRADGEESPSEPGAAKPTDSDGPSEAEVKRWRRMRDAVQRQDAIRKSHARYDRALGKLSVNLTPRQREKIYATRAAFEPRMREIWGEIKSEAQATVAAGGEYDGQSLRAKGAAQIQQEFAASITGIVHQADAEAVAGAMFSRGK